MGSFVDMLKVWYVLAMRTQAALVASDTGHTCLFLCSQEYPQRYLTAFGALQSGISSPQVLFPFCQRLPWGRCGGAQGIAFNVHVDISRAHSFYLHQNWLHLSSWKNTLLIVEYVGRQ